MNKAAWLGLIGAVGALGCTASLDLPPDTTPPELLFDNPHDGAVVSGIVGVEVSAFDNVSVEKVQIFIDGTLRGTFYARPYFVQWSVQNLPNGSTHVLKAEAIDPSRNKGTAQITVTVQGGPG
jgi:hypothetical protein